MLINFIYISKIPLKQSIDYLLVQAKKVENRHEKMRRFLLNINEQLVVSIKI